jgi:hypothetical protein
LSISILVKSDSPAWPIAAHPILIEPLANNILSVPKVCQRLQVKLNKYAIFMYYHECSAARLHPDQLNFETSFSNNHFNKIKGVNNNEDCNINCIEFDVIALVEPGNGTRGHLKAICTRV